MVFLDHSFWFFIGINHGDDIVQVFNVEGLTRFLSSPDEDFSRSFVKAFVDFANDT